MEAVSYVQYSSGVYYLSYLFPSLLLLSFLPSSIYSPISISAYTTYLDDIYIEI